MRTAIPLLCAVALCCALLDGQSPFRATRFAGLPAGTAPAGIARGDIDGDGDLDLLLANDYLPVTVLRNDGNGLFTDGTPGRFVSPPNLDNHCIDLVDIDNDGDLDALLGNEDFVANQVYVNDGTGVFTNVSATALPPQAGDTKNQVVADFDGDGDPDWLSVDLGGSRFYENNGAGVFTDQTATRLVGISPNLGYEYWAAPPAQDLDGDGDLDVLLPGPGGLLLNQGGVLSPAPLQLPAIGSFGTHYLVDVDGDGDIDVFASRGRRLLVNQGGGTFVDVTATALGTSPPAAYGCFDVDRDGDCDLVGANQIGFNDGAGVFTFVASSQPQPFAAPGVELHDVADDYDGDGDLEMPGLPNLLHHVDAPAPPRIGAQYSVELHTRLGGASPGLLVAAVGAGSLPIGAFGTLRLDPASALVVGFQTGATPLTVTWTLPNVAAFVGTPLNYQGVVADPLVGIQLTNTFGDAVR